MQFKAWALQALLLKQTVIKTKFKDKALFCVWRRILSIHAAEPLRATLHICDTILPSVSPLNLFVSLPISVITYVSS